MATKRGRGYEVGVFLLYEGLPPTIVESQIIAHAHALARTGIAVEVWAFPVTRKARLEARGSSAFLQQDYGIPIRVFRGIKPAIPLSAWVNAALFLWWMWRLNVYPSFVHARTEYAASVAAMAKRWRTYRLIWDARGDTLSEHKEDAAKWPLYKRWLAPLKARAIAKRLQVAAKYADAAIFVSDALRRLQGPNLGPDRYLVLPCVADEELFYYSPNLRAAARLALGYERDALVLIYVGSTAPWQCVPETVSLMEYALRKNAKTHALVLTSDREKFESQFSVDVRERVVITSGTLREINRFLNAGDFGFLLRKQHPINHVASPVKFAEYSLAGLRVITTNAVDQVSELGRTIGNTIDVDAFRQRCEGNGGGIHDRDAIAQKARRLLGRSVYLTKLTAVYMPSRRN